MNERTENGCFYYLWFNLKRSRWQLNIESDFKNKSDGCAMYLQSAGKNVDFLN